MKINVSVNLFAFATALFFSIGIVSTIFNNNTFSYFNKENNFKTRVKIYNFLIADKSRYSKYMNLTAEQRLKLRPDVMNIFVKEREILIKSLRNERINADTTDLPEDFRASWKKSTIAQKNATDMFYLVVNSKAKSDSLNESGRESIAAAEEFKGVVRNYGFEIGDDLTIIE